MGKKEELENKHERQKAYDAAHDCANEHGGTATATTAIGGGGRRYSRWSACGRRGRRDQAHGAGGTCGVSARGGLKGVGGARSALLPISLISRGTDACAGDGLGGHLACEALCGDVVGDILLHHGHGVGGVGAHIAVACAQEGELQDVAPGLERGRGQLQHDHDGWQQGAIGGPNVVDIEDALQILEGGTR